MHHLTVIHPFQAGEGGKKYKRGDRITDAAEVEAILNAVEGQDSFAHHCHKTLPDPEQP